VSRRDWTDEERADIAALRRAAEKLASRRGFMRRSALATAWAIPVIESLTTVPEAYAQGHHHKKMTKNPHHHHHG
jgi:hypothetical protein